MKPADARKYIDHFSECVQLRDSAEEKRIIEGRAVRNFGDSKGCTYSRVLIFATGPMSKWIKNNNEELKPISRSKFYVSVTRAVHGVAIVMDFDNNDSYAGVKKFI